MVVAKTPQPFSGLQNLGKAAEPMQANMRLPRLRHAWGVTSVLQAQCRAPSSAPCCSSQCKDPALLPTLALRLPTRKNGQCASCHPFHVRAHVPYSALLQKAVHRLLARVHA